ncbi:MAG TPA: SDR family oxidoreductase [Nocardioides sp.]|nr:SDR family oxidoreductase [Nocardioides sp.]
MEIRYALAVVTGAGGGLGREVAVALARRGAAVLAADRDPAAAQETATLVREQRVGGWAFACDVTEEPELRALAGRARDLGGADVLVNNAGGWTPGGEQFPAAPYAAWSRTLDLNLRAPMLLTQLFLDDLEHRRGPRGVGAVVNVASSATLGTDGYDSPEYAAAKAGLIRFTTALGDLATGARARVTAVAPGWIGLPRAHAEWAALDEDQQALLPPLVPPADVTRAVVDLVAHGRPGQVVELL